ncbi:MAG TPA: hypothetical protein VF692_07290, partial [Pyrinomonadaceae bacterium]|jgi:hypothetical protein
LEVVEARIVLEAWDGYLYKHRENGKEITDGKIRLDFGGYNGDKSINWQAEINAYNHLLENQYEIRDSIIRSLIEKFDWLKETYDWDQDDDVTPDAKVDFDFKGFIGPLSVSFDEESKDDIAYLEWHFQCEWDEEHGLAVITHQERVIDLDRGETDIWKIYEDNGTLAEKQKEYDEGAKNFKPPKRQKPWWKFW